MRRTIVNLLAFSLLATLAATGPAYAAACKGPLTGRTVTLRPSIGAFGSVQAGAPLPMLRPGEYALTLDDGPSPISTQKLLDILDRACVRATFMEVGNNARQHPELSRAVLAHGQGLGSHSMDHKPFSSQSDAAWQADMLDGAEAVEQAGWGRSRGTTWRFFRMPGGAGVPLVAPAAWRAFANSHHLVLAGYDFSGDDWKNGPPADSLKIMLSRLKDRGVILVHEGQPNTLLFLPMLLDELQRRGAKIVALRLAQS